MTNQELIDRLKKFNKKAEVKFVFVEPYDDEAETWKTDEISILEKGTKGKDSIIEIEMIH